MKYKCLVFDHDDTTVNSTATIHHPCFQLFLDQYRPGRVMSLEEYFIKNFDPGFMPMCKSEFGLSDEELEIEGKFWQDYVKNHVPVVYPGIREIMQAHKAAGGILCVVSHSHEHNILRDFEKNNLPTPDAVYGWSRPIHERKPYPFPLLDITERFGLDKTELLMIDDLKPGYDMAVSCGVDFAAVGWSNNIPQIESFMRQNSRLYFKTVDELAAFLA